MTGELDLKTLLREMNPILRDGEFVFGVVSSLQQAAALDPLCIFREREGYTVILEKDQADAHGIGYNAVWAWIEISIHSSLEAVGFLAAMSAALAQAGISSNAVSAFYHDHLFVQAHAAQQALAALQSNSEPPAI